MRRTVEYIGKPLTEDGMFRIIIHLSCEQQCRGCSCDFRAKEQDPADCVLEKDFLKEISQDSFRKPSL